MKAWKSKIHFSRIGQALSLLGPGCSLDAGSHHGTSCFSAETWSFSTHDNNENPNLVLDIPHEPPDSDSFSSCSISHLAHEAYVSSLNTPSALLLQALCTVIPSPVMLS